MRKKGSLNLSVNAVVILILAVTMLGLGLSFIKGMFKDAFGDLGQIREDIRDRVIRDLKDSNERLAFFKEDIQIRRSAEENLYFGIKNEDDTQSHTYGILMSCSNRMGGESAEDNIAFTYFFESPDVEPGDVEVLKSVVSVKPDAPVSTYQCSVEVCEDGQGNTGCSPFYAKKNFFVTAN